MSDENINVELLQKEAGIEVLLVLEQKLNEAFRCRYKVKPTPTTWWFSLLSIIIAALPVLIALCVWKWAYSKDHKYGWSYMLAPSAPRRPDSAPRRAQPRPPRTGGKPAPV